MGELQKHLDGRAVVVGVLGANDRRSDQAPKREQKSKSVASAIGGFAALDHIGNVELAIIQEFGLGVPERSFLRRTFDKRREEWKALAERLMRLVLKEKLTADAMLKLLGEKMKADIKREITSGAGIPPPNAQSTIDRKGSSRPLVDSGRLVGSIDYEVRSLKK